MSTIKVNNIQNYTGTQAISIDSSGNATFAGTVVSNSSMGMRNRIINGAMVINQRGNPSTVNAGQIFVSDRWRSGSNPGWVPGVVFSSTQSTDAPAGFNNSTLITTTTAVTPSGNYACTLTQPIEGYNIADFNLGSSNAKTFTLSFWAKSSLTGTFSGEICSSVGTQRAYLFTYSLPSANTWTYITVTIPGDVSSTSNWNISNGVGMYVRFSLGASGTALGSANSWFNVLGEDAVTGQVNLCATNGATWYITGAQLEVGSKATPFEFRQYGTELALCQRYYAKSYAQGTVPGTATSVGVSGSSSGGGGTYTDLLTVTLPVIMRTTATVSFWDTAGNASKITRLIANTATTNSAGSPAYESDRSFTLYGTSGVASANGLYAHWTASAEL